MINLKTAFEDKTVIVTGGGSGIGLSLCRSMAANGARVVIADIDMARAELAALDLRNEGYHAWPVGLDVADESAVYTVVNETAERFGTLDYFFNNAGIGISGDARDLSMSQWKKVFDVNLYGVLYGTLAAYGVMAGQGHGHIVNIASMAGFAPFSINTPYTASKYGVVGFTQALRHETVPLGVHMTLVCPGIVRTPFYDAMEIEGTDRETFKSRLPGRLISPDMAARIILRGVARKKSMIVFPMHARALRLISRFFPSAIDIINRRMVKEFRSLAK